MNNRQLCLLFILLLTAVLLLSSCVTSERVGVGPFDFTDYASLEARQELREAQTQEALYDDFWDYYITPEADMYDLYYDYGYPEDYGADQ